MINVYFTTILDSLPEGHLYFPFLWKNKMYWHVIGIVSLISLNTVGDIQPERIHPKKRRE